jgi:hypothetical protein
MKSYHSSALPITAAATWSGLGASELDDMASPWCDLPRLAAAHTGWLPGYGAVQIRFLAAAESVALELSCAVIIVHHCGIDASRPRGHTSLSGTVESQLKVERGNTDEVIVTVELAKDFAEGTEIVSRLERIELGTDADGDPITSLVVLPAEGPIQRRTATRKLSPRQRLALAALDECAISSGTTAPASLQLPARTVVVQLNAWREELYRKGVLDREAKSPREEFKRIRLSLHARNLIGVNGEFVWKA